MSSQKYNWNPLTNSLEDRDNPTPHVSSKEPTAGAVYTSKLDQVAYPKHGSAPTEIAAAKKLSNEERRKKHLNKVWGLTDPKDPPVTGEDWKNETPRYRKHLADTIAEGQQTIFYNKDTGGWRDKWDEERKPEEVLKEQNEIQKTYDSIFTPDQQKKYQQSLIKPVQRKKNEFQQKKIDNYNKQRSNSLNDLKAPKITKEHPPQDNSKMIQEIEQLAKMRLQQDINSQEFKKIMTTPEDPDLRKGINSIPGNEPMKKAFKNLPKFKNRSQELVHAKNALGIGPHLTGEND